MDWSQRSNTSTGKIENPHENIHLMKARWSPSIVHPRKVSEKPLMNLQGNYKPQEQHNASEDDGYFSSTIANGSCSASLFTSAVVLVFKVLELR